jgi:chemotaxis protein methyltransferase CheR
MNFPKELQDQIKVHIAERCGLYFRDHDLKNLEVGVTQRMKACGFDSVHSYYLHLTTSDDKETEFRELLNLLTINHTYFFRNEPQFLAFKDKVVPELIERKMQKVFENKNGAKPCLRIWSAGCSTGEEPYTIAMILREVIPHPEDWDIEILATDASSDAMAKAKRGIYSENSMRLVEEPYRSKYFTQSRNQGTGLLCDPRPVPDASRNSSKVSGEWEISSEIKQMVRFGFLNLIEDPYPPELDVIFCRNVTIYFETRTTIKIMENFAATLTDPGYLFLGYSESLQFLTDKFRMASWQDGIYYRKATERPEEARLALSWQPEEPETEEYVPEMPLKKLAAIVERREPVALSPEEFEAVRQQILRFIYLKEYSKAMALIEKVSVDGENMADIHYLAADILANRKQHAEAKARLKKALAIDSFFAPAYYLLGCMDLEDGRITQSKEQLNRALYIDKDFVMARFYMANVFRSEGRISEAIREYRNTLAALSKGAPSPRSQMILQSNGFSLATLKSVCSDNLERLKMEPR